MKKILVLAALSLLCSKIVFAQDIRVEYLVEENKNTAYTSTDIIYHLKLRGTESKYYNPVSDASQFRDQAQITEVSAEANKEGVVKFGENVSANIKEDFLYKNYLSDEMLFNELLVNKKVVVKEAISLFDWSIMEGADSVILGYTCQKAVTEFRGRTYEAYFSPELNLYGGPWKFDGLPGLILSVKSTDNYFIISPLKIVANDKDIVIQNPYKGVDTISWDEFVAQFEEKLKRILKLMKSNSDGGGGGIKITDRIEDLGIGELTF